MTLDAVQGQPRAVGALRAALRSDSVHHAYLFTGPEGVGKELAAIGLAQALACTERPREGCGECSACRRISRRNHPDVTWLMPEEEMVARGFAGRSDIQGTPSRDIRVDQVRQLQERLSLRALEGARKVAIVASAQQLNPQAQNALLKTLEEPPSGTVLLLLASAPDKLLPTIRSRCSAVRFGPLPRELIAEIVRRERKLDEPTAALVAVMAGGSLAQALALDVKGLSERKAVIERFESVRSDDARTVLRFAEEFGGDRGQAEDALRILALWIRDLATLRSGGTELGNRDLEELARKAAGSVSDAALHRRHQLIADALEALVGHNAAPRLQLERALIGMLDVAGSAA
jgi:DNA polymerase III subunit delta'